MTYKSNKISRYSAKKYQSGFVFNIDNVEHCLTNLRTAPNNNLDDRNGKDFRPYLECMSCVISEFVGITTK